jgi:hypothetical protein
MLGWIADMVREAWKSPIDHEKARTKSLPDEIRKTLVMTTEKQVLDEVTSTLRDYTLDLQDSEKFDEMWLLRMTSTSGLSMVVVVFGGLSPRRKLTQQEIDSIRQTMESNRLIAIYTLNVTQSGFFWG